VTRDAQMGVERQIPEDLKGLWAEAQMVEEKPWHFMQIQPKKIIALVERIADLAAEVETLRGNLLKTTNNLSSELDELLRVKTALGDSRAAVETLKGLLRDFLYNYEFGEKVDAKIRAALGTDQQLQIKGEQE